MGLKSAQQRLEFLTRQLSAPEWRLLGAVAIERELGLTPIVRLATAFGLVSASAKQASPALSAPGGSRVLARSGARRLAPARTSAPLPLPSLEAWLNSGLLIEVGSAKVQSPGRPGGSEPVLAVHADFRQLVSRRVARDGELQAIAETTHGVLGERSLGALSLLLQTGHVAEFQRYTYALPRATGRFSEELGSEDLLREAITRPFDASWFESVFKENAVVTAGRVLGDALAGLHECDELFAWLRAQVEAESAVSSSSAGTQSAPNLAILRQTLAEHALLRGRPELVESYSEALPRGERLAFHAAAAYQSGDQAGAQRWLDALLEVAESDSLVSGERAEGRREKPRNPATVPNVGAAAPLIGLLFLARGTAAAQGQAKRWLAARSPDDALAGAERGFRTLLRYAALPEAECVRLDVHQISRTARGWELLLFGLTVHLYLKQEVTRAAWAVQLTRSGAAWTEAGYSWLGRQALLLARALDASHFERELSSSPALSFIGTFEQRSGEFALCDLVTPKPEWERVLDALEQLADEPSAEVEGVRRVAWFVNLNDKTLDRPALQELGQSGWSRGRRLLLAQLYAHAGELPAEDVAVLQSTREVSEGKREFLPEAFEALIGHPRVFNGARGGTRVEVVRGLCRVETSDEGGFLSIVVSPAGAALGVNVVVEDDARISVYRVTPAMQRVIDVLPQGVRVPRQRAEQALSVLGKLSLGVEVQSRHLGADRKIEADPTPCLRIAPHAGAWVVQPGVRPFGARGRFFLAGTGRPAISLYTGGERLLCVRDLELERARLSQLIAACPTLLERTVGERDEELDGAGSWDLGLEALLDLLLELRETSERAEIEWPESEALRVRGRVTSQSLQGTLRRKKGWYIATGGVQLDAETEIGLGEIAASVGVAEGRFVRLPNGDFLALEARVRRAVEALQGAEPLAQRPRELQIHEAALGTLGTLAELGAAGAGGGFTFDAETESWLERVNAVKSQSFEAPPGLAAELRSYQLAGYRWLACLSTLGLGACLADDMGLGKTVQILALLLTRMNEGPTLVIAPTSVCTNWLIEAARFAPGLRAREYAGPARAELLAELRVPGQPPGDLVVASYALLQQDADALCSLPWGTVVLDEAQFIKNAKSLRAQAARRLEAKCRIAATGTPVENHLGDLWSILSFVNPGLLGSWRSFNARFLKPIEQRGDPAVRALLQREISPFVLRRTKSEVLADLPPLTLVHHMVTLGEAEALGYQRLRREVKDKLFTREGRRDNKLEILAEITRLRRYCCHPRLVVPDAASEGAKIEALIDLVLELRDNQHRVLVFSQFVDFLGLVRERFAESAISYQYLDGSTPKAERQARVDAFQAGEGTVFLISLKAGGFGLNLTAADYVIHLDPWWNPAVEAQATDRAHRIGQERPVTVYRLITKDTIEESIVALYQHKQALAEALLSGGSQAAQLSAGELVDLIEREPLATPDLVPGAGSPGASAALERARAALGARALAQDPSTAEEFDEEIES